MAIALVQLGKYGFVTSDASTAEAIAQETGAKPRGEENAPSAGSHTGHSSNASDERHGGTSARSSSSANGKVTAEVEVDDLYRALGVGRDANEDQIKAAYRKLALELHPDRNPSKDAATRFAYVSKAYTVLRDAELRARYDVLLSSSKPAHKAA
ncbi:MAG: DnaJ domain-containing protein [Tepidisphaera sp.]|nr:DnaJ domain-containing protein [Tepidisphaera sp.]